MTALEVHTRRVLLVAVSLWPSILPASHAKALGELANPSSSVAEEVKSVLHSASGRTIFATVLTGSRAARLGRLYAMMLREPAIVTSGGAALAIVARSRVGCSSIGVSCY